MLIRLLRQILLWLSHQHDFYSDGDGAAHSIPNLNTAAERDNVFYRVRKQGREISPYNRVAVLQHRVHCALSRKHQVGNR
jgi:hypothetical protein